MFEPVSESFARMANIAAYLQSIGNKPLAYKKVQRAAKKRPIEKSKKTGNPKSSTDNKPSDHNIDQDLCFENYDKDGNIISRFPKRKKRIGEIA